jgi:hypothetical protein
MLFPPFSTKLLDDGHAIVSGHLPPEFGVGCGFLSKGGQASEPELHAGSLATSDSMACFT